MRHARVLVVGEPAPAALIGSFPADVDAVVLKTLTDLRAVMREAPWPRRTFLHWAFVTRAVIRSLEDLRKQGVVVPVTVYLDSPSPEAYARAWLAAGPLRASLVQPPDVRRQVRELLRTDSEAVATYVRSRLAISTAFGAEFLDLLASGGEAWTLGADSLASRQQVSRTALFEKLHREGLPPPEMCQFLFRAIHAAQILQQGGSHAHAAHAAAYSEPAALRRALDVKLGLRVEDLRQPGWRWLAERWISRCVPARQVGEQRAV